MRVLDDDGGGCCPTVIDDDYNLGSKNGKEGGEPSPYGLLVRGMGAKVVRLDVWLVRLV